MKSFSFVLILIFFFTVFTVQSQQFTRITDGSLVNDMQTSLGVCFIDYDEDGYPDLYVVNGGNVPDGEKNCLYHNNGDGTFTRIDTLAIVENNALGQGASWADFDNDGDIDVVLTNFRMDTNILYINDGSGDFYPDPGGAVGAGGPVGSVTPSWIDYDLDGRLDLFIGNSTEVESEEYPPYRNFLYHNDGNGILTEITNGEIVTLERHTYSANWGDYDNDGDPDLAVSNNVYEPIDLFRNDGAGSFTRLSTGFLGSDTTNGGGVAWADFDNDGDMDLFIASFWPGPSLLYKNNGDGTFSRVNGHGIDAVSNRSSAGIWADYDNDGDQDIYVWLSNWQDPPASKGYLFENQGDGTFTRVIDDVISSDTCTAESAVWGDYDRDGDLDLFVARYDPTGLNNSLYLKNRLYRNNGNDNHWITIKPVGTTSNRSGIGTKVHVKATINGSAVWQLRELMTQTGLRAQSPLELHFGLGDASIIDSIKLQWPSGTVQVLTDVETDQILSVIEICCVGYRGNTDCSNDVEPDISDITRLIDYLYISHDPLCCPAEADADGSGGEPDISDITRLIDYLYLSHTPLVSCP